MNFTDTNSMTPLDAALWYASQGVRLFPVQPGTKRPMPGWPWKKIATTDPEVIRSWWTTWPNANIGLVMGAESGIIALDIDVKNDQDGKASFEAMLNAGETLETFTGPIQKTPSGGWHMVFRYVAGLSNFTHTGTHGGLDMRTDGGYIVASPSVIDGVPYAWDQDGPVLPMWPKLLAECQAWSRPSSNAAGDMPDIPEEIPDYHTLGLDQKYLNYLDHGDFSPWGSESEAIYAVAGAIQCRVQDPGLVFGMMSANPYVWACAERHRQHGDPAEWLWKHGIGKMVKQATRLDPAKVFDPVPGFEDSTKELPQEPRLKVVPTDLAGTIPPIRYVLPPILPREDVTLMSGHGGSGKSNFALVLAAHVACGKDWAGLPIIQGRVLFVSLEDPADVLRLRLRRIAAAYGLDLETIEKGVTIADGSDGASLAYEQNDHGIRRLVQAEAYNELCSLAAGHDLIIIDNASDAYDADENSRRLVRAFIRSLKQIAREQYAAVLLLAHIDKNAARHGAAGNSYSGSTAWHNSVRSRLALIEDKGLELRHEKANLGPRIEPVPLAWTEEGVLVPASHGSATERMSERDRVDDETVLATLQTATNSGCDVPTGRTGPNNTHFALRAYPEFPEDLRKNRDRFWAALTRLERAGSIKRETYTSTSRHKRERWVCASSVARALSPIPPAATRAHGWAAASVCEGSELTQNQRKPAHLDIPDELRDFFQ